MAMYISGLVYCNTHETDGFIPESVAPVLAYRAFNRNAKKAISTMLEAKLWDKVEAGYQVHDFLEFNKSKAEIEDIKRKRSEAGKKGRSSSKPTHSRETLDEQMLSKCSANDEQMLEQAFEQKVNINPNPLTLSPKDKELTTTTVSARAKNSFQVYEEEIGLLSPLVRDRILEAEEAYTETWVIEAIHEATRNNVRKWAYIEAILKGWKQNGFKADRRKYERKGARAPVNQGLEAIRAMAEADGETLDGVLGDLSRFGRYTPPDGQVIDVEAQNG